MQSMHRTKAQKLHLKCFLVKWLLNAAQRCHEYIYTTCLCCNEWVVESFITFIRWFRNEASHCLNEWVIKSLTSVICWKNADSFSKLSVARRCTTVLLRLCCRSTSKSWRHVAIPNSPINNRTNNHFLTTIQIILEKSLSHQLSVFHDVFELARTTLGLWPYATSIMTRSAPRGPVSYQPHHCCRNESFMLVISIHGGVISLCCGGLWSAWRQCGSSLSLAPALTLRLDSSVYMSQRLGLVAHHLARAGKGEDCFKLELVINISHRY